jgi:hypothetical protein
MSRADELRARFEAELAVVELEEQFAAVKETDMGGPEYQAIKEQLREARRSFRRLRAGDATISPATIEVTAAVHTPGGEG